LPWASLLISVLLLLLLLLMLLLLRFAHQPLREGLHCTFRVHRACVPFAVWHVHFYPYLN
jgi:hypothetical protein